MSWQATPNSLRIGKSDMHVLTTQESVYNIFYNKICGTHSISQGTAKPSFGLSVARHIVNLIFELI